MLHAISILLFFFDVGSPSVNAVCKIELYNGSIHYGALQIARGGYYGNARSGFSTRSWDRGERRLIFFGFGKRKINLDGLDFCEYLCPSQSRFNPSSTKVLEDGKITLEKCSTEMFDVKQEIFLCQELPPSQQLITPCNNEDWIKNLDRECDEVRINIHQIRNIEILEVIPDTWKEKISAVRDLKYDDADYVEPIWFHEAVKNEMLRNWLITALD